LTFNVQVPEIGDVQPGYWENLTLQYVFDQWTETDPAKGSDLIDDTNRETVRFRVGFPDTSQSYEIVVLRIATDPTQAFVGGGRLELQTTLEFTTRMKRIDRDKPDLQLLRMELELMRIIMSYSQIFPRGITGIKDIRYGGNSMLYSATDTWAKADWRSVTRAYLIWEIAVTV
jgi:hypothetical protein